MIRIAICDNEQEFLTQLDSTLTQWSTPPARISTECFDNGDALISAHKNSPFDIILLDIVMPIFTGIETAHEIRKFDKNVKIVFLTSSPEFAVDSYSVKASNYLLKPVSTHKLFICIDELYEEIKDEDKHKGGEGHHGERRSAGFRRHACTDLWSGEMDTHRHG